MCSFFQVSTLTGSTAYDHVSYCFIMWFLGTIFMHAKNMIILVLTLSDSNITTLFCNLVYLGNCITILLFHNILLFIEVRYNEKMHIQIYNKDIYQRKFMAWQRWSLKEIKVNSKWTIDYHGFLTWSSILKLPRDSIPLNSMKAINNPCNTKQYKVCGMW